MNIGGEGNNRDFMMSRKSITAPFHTTMQVQSSACSMIPFWIICGSQSCVDEDSSLLVYYTELIGKEIIMCQSSMLTHLKVKVSLCMSWSNMGNLRYSSTHSEFHCQRKLGGRLYALAFITLGTDLQHLFKKWLGASHNQSRHFRERKVSCYCCE